jgi:hypothetical protein
MLRNCFCFFVRRNEEDVVPIAKWQYIITVMPIVLLRIIYTQSQVSLVWCISSCSRSAAFISSRIYACQK